MWHSSHSDEEIHWHLEDFHCKEHLSLPEEKIHLYILLAEGDYQKIHLKMA